MGPAVMWMWNLIRSSAGVAAVVWGTGAAVEMATEGKETAVDPLTGKLPVDPMTGQPVQQTGKGGFVSSKVAPKAKSFADWVADIWARFEDRNKAGNANQKSAEQAGTAGAAILQSVIQKQIDQTAEENTKNLSIQESAISGFLDNDKTWTGFFGTLVQGLLHTFAPDSAITEFVDKKIKEAKERIDSGFYNKAVHNTNVADPDKHSATPKQLQDAVSARANSSGTTAAPGGINNGVQVPPPPASPTPQVRPDHARAAAITPPRQGGGGRWWCCACHSNTELATAYS